MYELLFEKIMASAFNIKCDLKIRWQNNYRLVNYGVNRVY